MIKHFGGSYFLWSGLESTRRIAVTMVDSKTKIFPAILAVFPPLNLHDHDYSVRISSNDQDRQKKFLQNRGKSLELKEVLEKDKNDGPSKHRNKLQPSGSKSTEKPQNGKSDQPKTPTKLDKTLVKQELQQMKSEQKAQQKLEKEQQKLEKEQLKEQLKLEKEHQKEQLKLEKEQLKLEKEQKSKMAAKGLGKSNDYFASLKDNPQLKTQKSIDLSCLKHQKSVDVPKSPARKSVDLQYKQDLLDSSSFASSFSSIQLKSKK